MRTFVLATFVLSMSFGVSSFAFAATDTDTLPPYGAVNDEGTNPAPSADTTGSNTTLLNPLSGVDCSRGNGNCLSAFLLNVLDFVITIGSIVVILMLVYVGYLFVIAQGKEAEIREARNALLWTVIGALILLGSKAIAMGVQATISALGG